MIIMAEFNPKLNPDLAKEIADELNKILNIPFLSESQEQLLLEFVLNLIIDKLNKFKTP